MNWETDSEDSFMSCSSNFESAILKTEFLENSLDLHFGSENGSTMTSMTEIGEEEIATSTPIDTAMIPIPDSEQPTATPLPDQPAKEQPYVESPNLRNGSHETTVLPKPVEKEGLLSSSRSERKSDSERDSQRWRGGSGSPPPRGRPDRSRSRSWERRSTTRRSRSKSRRSRSRGRERDRSRAWRNRSPPPRSRYDRDRKMRSWSKSPPPRSRSRSPPSKLRSRYRNRSRSRSHSPYDSLTPTGGTPTHDSNVDETRNSVSLQSVVHSKRRCRDYEEKGFCMRGEMCPFDHGKDPVVLEDVGQVLSSFSTPRLPPQTLEPPVPPMVAPGLGMHHRPPPNLVEYNPDAPSMEPRMWSKQPFRTAAGRGLMQRGGMMRAPLLYPPHHQRELISVPVMEGQENPQYYNTMSNPMKRQCPPEFSNEMESMPPMKQRFDYSRLGPRGRAGNCSLQLKKVPVGLNNIAHLHNHFFKFGKIVNIQVSFEGDPEAALITFTSHAEASAAYKSTEAVLNNRFIKVFWYNPDKDFNVPRGMFHHRFRPPHPSLPPPIPPFQPPPLRPTEIISYLYEFYVHGWMSDNKLKPPPPPPPYPPPPPCPFPPLLRPQNKQENISPLIRPSAKERLGAPVILNATSSVNNQMDQTNEMEKVLISGANITKTVYIPTALDRKQALPLPKRMIVTTYTNTAQVAQNNIKKKQEEKRKEALKLTQHLCKRKYDLIQKLLHHQKQLIEKMEKGNISPEQRTEIISTIEGFQDNIDMIRKDIKTVVAKPINNAVKVSPQLVKRTREETQKQILDAELDLFNQQQEGKDTSELQKRVLELKTKAHNLGLLANNGVLRLSRGGARFRSCRGRGGINPHATVDHRPTKLLVSGFESDDKAEVLEHFKKFGEVADHIWDEATPALVIQFKTRKDAETAMATGRNFQDRLLSVTWFSSVQNMGMRSSRSVILLNDSTMSDLLSEHDDEEEALRINLDQHEDFLLQDEEEEEDEERSWRR